MAFISCGGSLKLYEALYSALHGHGLHFCLHLGQLRLWYTYSTNTAVMSVYVWACSYHSLAMSNMFDRIHDSLAETKYPVQHHLSSTVATNAN